MAQRDPILLEKGPQDVGSTFLNPLLPRVAPMSDTDKSETRIRRADDNLWFCLATLYGEEEAGSPVNYELRDKNRSAWNRWIAGALGDLQRAELLAKGFPESELKPLSPDEKSAFYSAFAARIGGLPPEPEHGVDFSHTHFNRKVVFDGFLFAPFLKARSARFSGDADFAEATFVGKADFEDATFSDFADFDGATFFDFADFSGATFSTSTIFESTTFSDNAYFVGATFANYVSFSAATFSGQTTFCEATFSYRVSFIDAKWAAITTFENADFKEFVPDFRGATMHEATEWHGVSWPKPPRSKVDAQTQIYAYERLRLEMERLKKHDDEQTFFRKELRARRRLFPILSANWLLNAIYQALSDYGNSFSRPLLWLGGVFAAGIAIFTQVPLCAGQPMPFKLAARLSFANIFIFLNDKRELIARPDMTACLSDTTAAVSAAQSVSGVVLLFLLILALRNRFRMRGSS
jgi:hypothetical protein